MVDIEHALIAKELQVQAHQILMWKVYTDTDIKLKRKQVDFMLSKRFHIMKLSAQVRKKQDDIF